MDKKNFAKEVRQKAKEALQLCDEVEQGKISAEEFEQRISKIRLPSLPIHE